jgi:hypothetical protein
MINTPAPASRFARATSISSSALATVYEASHFASRTTAEPQNALSLVNQITTSPTLQPRCVPVGAPRVLSPPEALSTTERTDTLWGDEDQRSGVFFAHSLREQIVLIDIT